MLKSDRSLGIISIEIEAIQIKSNISRRSCLSINLSRLRKKSPSFKNGRFKKMDPLFSWSKKTEIPEGYRHNCLQYRFRLRWFRKAGGDRISDQCLSQNEAELPFCHVQNYSILVRTEANFYYTSISSNLIETNSDIVIYLKPVFVWFFAEQLSWCGESYTSLQVCHPG